ncbi:MAG: lactonase family protein [Bacteroidota bacterium]
MKTLAIALTGLAMLAQVSCSATGTKETDENIRFYVGSGNGNQEYSIFMCELDPVNLAFSVLDSFAGATGSSYLALSPDGLTLFATSNESIPGDKGNNSVTSFRVNPEDHSLELVGKQSSQGSGVCHVQSSPKGDYLFAANYNSGHAAVLPVDAEGRLAAATSVVRGEGSGPVDSRQRGPHAHQVMTDPAGKFLLVPDLGTDKVMNYAFDRETGQLTPNPEQSWLEMPPGSGPRHLAFHPSGDFVYVLSEMGATVTACRFDRNSGVLTAINSSSIVGDDFTGNKQSAAVRVHPGGQYIYASNRDEESNLAVFRKEEDGGISRIQIISDIPVWPRDFNITPDGKFLVVAGARSNEIELYTIHQESGMLDATGVKTGLPGPTCVLFME